MKKLLNLMALTVAVFFLYSNAVWAEDAPETKALKEHCKKGNGRSCYKIGQRYRTVELDNKSAIPYYIRACDDNYLAGCNAAGILIQKTGKQYSPQWKEATKFYTKGCDVKDHVACFNLGKLKYEEGRQSRAKKYWKIACDLGNRAGCQEYDRINR